MQATVYGWSPMLSVARLIVVLLVASSCIGCVGGSEVAGRQDRVSLQVLSGPGGSTIALVPVSINGEGPFPFALDTGASSSLLDKEIVNELGIDIVGSAGPVTGVTGRTEASKIRVSDWRVGDIELPASTIVTVDLPEPDRRTGLAGLLGSDVLSGFGAVTIDYEAEQLVVQRA